MAPLPSHIWYLSYYNFYRASMKSDFIKNLYTAANALQYIQKNTIMISVLFYKEDSD